ncbi:MAG: ABC transporter ATP-binding protein [Pseudomonadota bacterium]
MTAPRLRIQQLARSLAGRLVLDDVSLHIHGGETLVLLGPNGAGKTTLLRSACGRLAPDMGTVLVCGANPRTDPLARSKIGLVPQSIALYLNLSVIENLEIFGRLMGVGGPLAHDRIERALVWSGLTDRRHSVVGTLSGGMQRGLNIVTSLLHQPDLLLLDEPTVGLDIGARERIHEMLSGLRHEGMSILITTHDLAEATLLADRVVFLIRGKVRLEGVPAKLVRQEFGDGREVRARFGQAPNEEQAAQLRQLGMSASRSGQTWIAPVPAGEQDMQAWHNRFADLQLSAIEIILREPGLESVFLKLTGEELDL